MPTATITTVSEGRVILSHVDPPVGDQSICLEIHRSTPGGYDVRFILLSVDEFRRLHDDIDSFAALPMPRPRAP